MNAIPIHKCLQDHMATFFEVRIAHENAVYARQAAQAAFQVAAKLDKLLNRYREDSEVSQIRALNVGETLRLNPLTFECIQIASTIEKLTGGAFSPSLGRQADFLRENRETALTPIPSTPLTRGLIFDSTHCSVSVSEPGLALDLGAIGKGFAIDNMAAELKSWDIERALIVTGESTILAMDGPSGDSPGWDVFLSKTKVLKLRHLSISSSGTSVKGNHIIDPLTGQPAKGPYRTWALHPSAAISDALSTAWMLLTSEEISEICAVLPGSHAFFQTDATSEPREISFRPT